MNQIPAEILELPIHVRAELAMRVGSPGTELEFAL